VKEEVHTEARSFTKDTEEEGGAAVPGTIGVNLLHIFNKITNTNYYFNNCIK